MLFSKARSTWEKSINPLLSTRLMHSSSGKKSVKNGITTRRGRKWPWRVRARVRAPHRLPNQRPALRSGLAILVSMRFVSQFPAPLFYSGLFSMLLPTDSHERPTSQNYKLLRPSPRTSRTRILAPILSRRSESGAPRSRIISDGRRVSRKNRR